MIIPFLKGIGSVFEAPVTWSLFFLNLLVLAVSMNTSAVGQAGLSKALQDDLFLQIQGDFYSQYIDYHQQSYSKEIVNLGKTATEQNDNEKLKILGSLAIRDQGFLRHIDSFSFRGDEVALEWWKKELREAQSSQALHPSYSLGLEGEQSSVMRWLTYQFVHSGFMHFAGNMFFLLIFGCSLELVIGGLGLIVVYLLSGILAAAAFLFLSGTSTVPLIGASGAVSGVMALYSFMFWNKPVRYLFFLFIPKRGYAGHIFLPGWITFALWALTDVAGYIGTMDEFGGVAHTAHMGGEMAGLLVGLSVYLVRRFTNKEMLTKQDLADTPPMWTRVA